MLTSGSQVAFVALGSNLGDSAGIIRLAMDRLQQFSVAPLHRSSLWRSSPVGCPQGAPEFINAVVALFPGPAETPESLLGKLQALEVEFGRQPKKVPNESRPLDLDLVTFRSETRNAPDLILPHPRAHLRRFVLEPLAEIAPTLVLSGQRENADQLRRKLDSLEQVERLDPLG